MKKTRKIRSPLGLAVLVLLFEKAMHPYEMAATLQQRRKEQSIKLRYGSLYTVISQLQREGFIEAAGTERDGGRPERTTYRITDAGETEMSSWLRALLAEPVKEYPHFEAALSLLPALPPRDVQIFLAERLGRLEEQERQMQADLTEAAAANMPAPLKVSTPLPSCEPNGLM
jgi:DNA-binding PadR family transcriptional regulator